MFLESEPNVTIRPILLVASRIKDQMETMVIAAKRAAGYDLLNETGEAAKTRLTAAALQPRSKRRTKAEIAADAALPRPAYKVPAEVLERRSATRRQPVEVNGVAFAGYDLAAETHSVSFPTIRAWCGLRADRLSTKREGCRVLTKAEFGAHPNPYAGGEVERPYRPMSEIVAQRAESTMQPCVIHGKAYVSLSAASRELGVSAGTVRAWCGLTPTRLHLAKADCGPIDRATFIEMTGDATAPSDKE